MSIMLIENCCFELSDCFLVETDLIDGSSLLFKFYLLVSEYVEEVFQHLETHFTV